MAIQSLVANIIFRGLGAAFRESLLHARGAAGVPELRRNLSRAGLLTPERAAFLHRPDAWLILTDSEQPDQLKSADIAAIRAAPKVRSLHQINLQQSYNANIVRRTGRLSRSLRASVQARGPSLIIREQMQFYGRILNARTDVQAYDWVDAARRKTGIGAREIYQQEYLCCLASRGAI